MKVYFQENKRIVAEINNHKIYSDSSTKSGGLGEKPNPFEAFKASIGSCMGYYVMAFCLDREIPTDCIWMDFEFVGEAPFSKVITKINVDERFPKKYLKAVMKSTDSCKVKKQFKNPPEFSIEVVSPVEAG